ncbi:MAG: NfeD family protein [Bacteroidales bacterium]
MKSIKTFITLSLLFICSLLSANKLFYVVDLKKEIGSTTWLYVKNGLQEAHKQKADAVIIHMNTYGGAVLFADSIRTAILNDSLPVYCFVDNNAASAGALIAIACDSIYMRNGANIGAATVVDQTGKQMPDKYQSYMRSTIRSTAESHGADTIFVNGKKEIRWKRNPLIAEAMVDSRIVVPGLIDSTKVLTFTTEEAIKNGYCEGRAESVKQLIEDRLHEKDYEIKKYNPTWFDEVKGFLMNPAFQAVLITLLIGGIYFELQSPGMGFPSIVAVTAAILYFAPLYIDGLAANWEIIIFIVGVILLIVEIFAIPGFGVFGIIGIILIIGALILSLIDNVLFTFDRVNEREWAKASMTVLIGFLASGGLLIYLANRIGHKGLFRKLALTATQETDKGYISSDLSLKKHLGETGIAFTDLRPSGKITINGVHYDAIAIYGFVEKGKPVIVRRQESAQLYVEEIKNQD